MITFAAVIAAAAILAAAIWYLRLVNKLQKEDIHD